MNLLPISSSSTTIFCICLLSFAFFIQVHTKLDPSLQVYPFEVKRENAASNVSTEVELETYVNGVNSTLSRLVGYGDVQGLGRLSKAIGRALDSAKKKTSTSTITYSEKETRKKKRKQVNLSMATNHVGTRPVEVEKILSQLVFQLIRS